MQCAARARRRNPTRRDPVRRNPTRRDPVRRNPTRHIPCAAQGILEFLTGPSEEADALRRRVLFLIVPMLNPDGVIIGNYRCSLASTDLNRRWAKPSPRLHPTICALRRLLLRLQSRQTVALYVDLHGEDEPLPRRWH